VSYVVKWSHELGSPTQTVEYSFEFKNEEDANRTCFGIPARDEVKKILEYEHFYMMVKQRKSIMLDVMSARMMAIDIKMGRNTEIYAKMLNDLCDLSERKLT